MSKSGLQHLSTLALRQRKARLLRTTKLPPNFLHASFQERFLKCGHPNCHCQQGDKHGPFFYLSRCLAQRQMRSLQLKQPSQIAQGRQGVEDYQKLLADLEEISWINWELLRRGEPLQTE
jgi:hypothetical protein